MVERAARASCSLAAEAAGTHFGAWDVTIVVFTFVVSIFLCVPIPVALVEERGVIASIGRSWTLTRGHRFTIWWVYVLLALFAGLVYSLFLFLPLPESGAVAFALDECGNLLLTSFACVLPNVIFHPLLEAREGIGSERLAEVFD
jgi:membrane-anchored glycerophosphoryl diester phosphodiesterase (GDPDase)